MGKYEITSGVVPAAQKVVIYGPEGVGKTTFASQFPGVVFIDTEGSTKKLNVQRLPKPSSWAMMMDMVNDVRIGNIPCSTLAIDTADWSEAMCIRAVCDKAGVKGIEDFGYGKGYVYVKEEFGKLLDLLEGVVNAGINVVITAHAQITKFEQPDEMGAYDRWTMKTSKQVAPLIREWCDTLLFANYKTIVVKDGDGKNAKSKGQGSRRVMYTTHHACWDAKNRDGLPDELPFDFASIAHIIPDLHHSAGVYSTPTAVVTAPVPTPAPAAQPSATPAVVVPEKSGPESLPFNRLNPAENEKALRAAGVPEKLLALMVANSVEAADLQKVVGDRGYFPADMPIRDYPQEFVEGCLLAAWDDVFKMIVDNWDLLF